MNWKTVRILFIHEMRQLLRDRRTVIVSIALPLVLMPLMLFISKKNIERRERNLGTITYKYAVTGSQAEQVRVVIARAKTILKSVPPDKPEKDGDFDQSNFNFEEVKVKDAGASLKNKEIDFQLDVLSGEEADALPKNSETKEPPAGKDQPVRLKGVPLIKIYFQGDNDRSQTGSLNIREFLSQARRLRRDAMLRERNFPVYSGNLFTVSEVNIATAGQVSGAIIGRYMTLFLLMLMLTGGSIAAMDIIAGEKERGTLETLLTTAVDRTEIVTAKQLSIAAVAIFITIIQIINLLVYVTFKIIKLPEDFIIQAPPIMILSLLLLFIPLATLVASMLLMISGYAKSYKEAQLYFLPIYLLSLVPAAAGLLPGVSLRSAIVLVPLANVSVAVREIMVGNYDWPMILITFIVMVLAATWMVRASARMLSEEKLISAGESDSALLAGGQALLSQHILRWYAVMWALLLAIAVNVPQLQTLRRQILFNQLVIFFGIPLLMIWKYKLNIREALSLRPVKPITWLAVLLSVPAGHLTANAVFRLANMIIPVPPQMLEKFSSQLIPSDVPTWQLVFLIAILPGICEEITFRGLLLYGLRRKFSPLQLIFLVGIIFGLFHIDLFRIIPTGFLGVILTAIALLTGSIFPCMVAHAGNNAFAIWAGRQGLPLANLSWWLYCAAAVIFALCLYILYRTRPQSSETKVEHHRAIAADLRS
jgi:sodium transport system permease protein